MKGYRKITLTSIYIFIATSALAFISIYTGWYLRLKGDKYGREYNKERVKQDQPVIEDFFVKKKHPNKQLNVWADTSESHVHLEKSYYTNLVGNLMYENDSYRPRIDSTWLKKKLGINAVDNLDYWRLTRTFYPGNGVDSYYLLYRLKGDTYRTATLNMHEGDSLYQTFQSTEPGQMDNY